jgi:hypothetical protein
MDISIGFLKVAEPFLKQRQGVIVPPEEKATASSYYYLARNNFRFMRKHATKGQYRSFLVYFFGYRF